jgi:hypothetical protein
MAENKKIELRIVSGLNKLNGSELIKQVNGKRSPFTDGIRFKITGLTKPGASWVDENGNRLSKSDSEVLGFITDIFGESSPIMLTTLCRPKDVYKLHDATETKPKWYEHLGIKHSTGTLNEFAQSLCDASKDDIRAEMQLFVNAHVNDTFVVKYNDVLFTPKYSNPNEYKPLGFSFANISVVNS